MVLKRGLLNIYNLLFFYVLDVKCEFLNPGGSVKDRIGFRMVEDAEAQGRLTPGCTIIEPSSGNTGIGLAMACAVKGYKCIIVMSEKMSTEKSDTLSVLGASVVRTPNEAAFDAPDGLFGVAKRLNEEIVGSVILDQYENPGNPLAHYDGTGEEIVQQCDGKVDMVVCGSGTGGTITGIAKKVKEVCPNAIIVAADPEGSALAVPESLNKTDVQFYEVEGIGYEFIPNVCHRDVVDRWIKTNDKVSFPLARRLISEEGILSGGSSGAALYAALQAAKELKEGQKCVVVLPDGIRNYMTKFVSDNWMEARNFKETENTFNSWWWNRTVTDIPLNETAMINTNTTCVEALEFLKQNRLSQVAVASDDGSLLGVLASAELMKKVVSQNLQLHEVVEKSLSKQFRRVTSNTSLGLVSRILEKDDFVAYVDDAGQCNGLITKLDFLTFVSEGQEHLKNGKYQNGNKN